MELVSRDTVLSIAMQYLPDDDGTCSKAGSDLREMLDEIYDINPLDAITVNHGHWDVNVYEMTCSVCGNCFGFEYSLIPQNSKRYSDSEKGTNPAITVTECKA